MNSWVILVKTESASDNAACNGSIRDYHAEVKFDGTSNHHHRDAHMFRTALARVALFTRNLRKSVVA